MIFQRLLQNSHLGRRRAAILGPKNAQHRAFQAGRVVHRRHWLIGGQLVRLHGHPTAPAVDQRREARRAGSSQICMACP